MKRIVAIALVATAFSVSTAHAVDTNGKKGIGVAAASGGPAGFAFNFGLNNMHVEAILGIPMQMPKDGETGYQLGLAAGLHYQALRAEHAAWTIGGRLNIGMNQPPVKDADSVTQFGLDIPMRVYWFADKHFSLHFEGGISIQMVGDKGAAFAGNAGAAEGNYIDFLSANAGMGATFWW